MNYIIVIIVTLIHYCAPSFLSLCYSCLHDAQTPTQGLQPRARAALCTCVPSSHVRARGLHVDMQITVHPWINTFVNALRILMHLCNAHLTHATILNASAVAITAMRAVIVQACIHNIYIYIYIYREREGEQCIICNLPPLIINPP